MLLRRACPFELGPGLMHLSVRGFAIPLGCCFENKPFWTTGFKSTCGTHPHGAKQNLWASSAAGMMHIVLAFRGFALYAEGVMRPLSLLSLSAAAVLLLSACDDFAGPPPIGSVRASDPVADSLMAQADAAKAEKHLSREEKCLKEIVQYHELAPNAAEARYRLGQVYEAKEDYREAFKSYSKLIDAYPQSSRYSDALNRQLALAMSGANGTLRTPVLWGAWHTEMESTVVIEWLRTIIAKAPYNDMGATASSILAKYLVEIEKYDDARLEYRRLVENYPDSSFAPEAQLMLARLWAEDHTRGNRNLVNLTNAREAYEEFSLRFPHHKDAGKALAQASDMNRLLVQQELEVGRYYLERSREYASAIFCFEDVIRRRKDNPEAAAEAGKLLEVARAKAVQPAKPSFL